MSDPRNVNVAGLSLTTAAHFTALSAILLAAPNTTAATAAAYALAEAVAKMSDIGA